MADLKIAQLTELAVEPAADDLFTIVDVSEVLPANQNKKIKYSTLETALGVTPAALTKTDDTNVTITLGGSPTVALLAASSITVGWTGVLSLARGGTNKNITAVAGAVVWSDADSLELSAAGTTGQALISGGTGSPTWFAPTAGSVIFAGTSGILQQDNAILFYDDTQNFLGVGINAALTARVHIKAVSDAQDAIALQVQSNTGGNNIQVRNDTSIWRFGNLYSVKDDDNRNTSWGRNALQVADPANAFYNSAFGDSCMILLDDGVGNTGVGLGCFPALLDGNLNTALGKDSGLLIDNASNSVFLGGGSGGDFSFGVALGTSATLTADNQMQIGSANGVSNDFITHWICNYSTTATHGIYFRTSTPEGAQAATRGSKAYVDNASVGIEYFKHNGTGNTGWKTRPFIFDKSVTDAAHTGDTNETKKYSVLIPANTLIAGSQIRVLARCKKTGTAGTNRFRFRIGTADDLTGNIVADTNMAATVLYAQSTRQILVKSTAAVEVFNTGVTNSPDDCTVSATALSSVAVDTTVANYFVISVQLGNSADTATFSGYYLEILY